MATVALAVQAAIDAGIVPTYNGSLSTANTYTVQNNGKMFLYVKNAGGSPCVLTFSTFATLAGKSLAAITVSVGAGTEEIIGPFAPSIYNDSSGNVNFTLSFITSVSIACIQLGV